jgi:hypothetical protein
MRALQGPLFGRVVFLVGPILWRWVLVVHVQSYVEMVFLYEPEKKMPVYRMTIANRHDSMLQPSE